MFRCRCSCCCCSSRSLLVNLSLLLVAASAVAFAVGPVRPVVGFAAVVVQRAPRRTTTTAAAQWARCSFPSPRSCFFLGDDEDVEKPLAFLCRRGSSIIPFGKNNGNGCRRLSASSSSSDQQQAPPTNDDGNDVPEASATKSLDWSKLSSSGDKSNQAQRDDHHDLDVANNNQRLDKDEFGNVHIPAGGVSVSDVMEESTKERYRTEVVPIGGLSSGIVAAQLVTAPVKSDGTTGSYSFEPVRYLLAANTAAPLSPRGDASSTGDDKRKDGSAVRKRTTAADAASSARMEREELLFVMVDVPPYSPQLVERMRSFMTMTNHGNNARAAAANRMIAILITTRSAIHNDDGDGTAMYSASSRGNNLAQWKKAFPDAIVCAYRLDIPRDCRSHVTHVLDGYGPFAMTKSETTTTGNGNDRNKNDDDSNNNSATKTKKKTNRASTTCSNFTFIETGRPLTKREWEYEVVQKIMNGAEPPPASDNDGDEDGDYYSAEAIRAREEDKLVLAAYTPGHTYGSVCYVFPQLGICCSGFTLPMEDNRNDVDNENDDDDPATMTTGTGGPALDCRGYITTSRGGIVRQMESARKLVESYADRIVTVFPARGDPFFFDEQESTTRERQRVLFAILDQYEKIGQIYERLGIPTSTSEGGG